MRFSPRLMRLGGLLSLFLSAPWTIATEGEGAESVVQAQLEAYNAHDIHAFMATYAATPRSTSIRQSR
jgi:hypothetical protein